MKKLYVLKLAILLNTSVYLTGCFPVSKQKDKIPFPDVLDKAAIIQDSIPDVSDNSLLLGNGDLNGLVNVADGKLIIRLSKNDVGDWRNDTSADSTLIPWNKLREFGAEGKLSTKSRIMGWHRYAYACPIPCGKVVISLPQGNNSPKAVLDIHRAVLKIGDEGQDERHATSVRCLYQANAFLIEGGSDAGLMSHEVEHLPRAEYSRSGNTIILYQKLPADIDWPGMSYAVALASRGNRTAVAVVSSFDADDPLSEAVLLAEKIAGTRSAKLIAGHESDWVTFWSKCGIRLDDEYLTGTWYRNLYFLRTVSRPETAAIGLFAGLVNDGKPAWHSAHTMNYNAEQPFWPAFNCNHPELASSYRWLISRYYENAKWLCNTLFGFGGIYFPHNLFTYQADHASSNQPGNGVHMHYPWGYSTGNTGWAVQNLWWEFEYGGKDPEFLRKIYPVIRDAALFYANFIKTCERLPDGKVKYGPSVSPEHFGFSSDLNKNWNDVHALAFARFTLEAGIRSAEFLHVDDELVVRLDEALQMLPDYPTSGKGGDRVVVNVEGSEPVVCNIPVPVFPVFPCEQVTWFSPEEQKSLFVRTIDRLQSNGNNDAMILCHARARLSMPGTYGYVVNSFRNRQRPNGILTLNVLGERWQRYNNHGHYSEQFAASAVISELLIQSVGDIVRVFPAWPPEKDAIFSDLRAKGGYLVSSEIRNKSVQSIKVKSTAGGIFKLLIPWEVSEIKVMRGDGKPQIIAPDNKGMIELKTARNESLVIQPGK